MTCPSCREQPYTYLQSLFPGKEEFKKNLKGRFTCRKCGTKLAYQKTKNGFYNFESPFYILLTVLIIAIMTFMWALIVNLENLISGGSSILALIILAVGMLSISISGGLLGHKYIMIEVFDPDEEQEGKKKNSWKGMVLMLVYSILAIFGFGFLSNYATNHSVSTLVYVLGTFLYLGICLVIAFQIMNSSLFKPKTDE